MKRTPRSFRTLGIEQLECRLALDGSPLVKGDLNRDGQVTVADVPAMMAAFADLKNYQVTQGLTDAQLLEIADADGSGTISNADIQAVINLVASAASAAPSPPGTWFDSNIQDAGIRAIGDQEFQDGVMDRNDMVKLFREVESAGAVTSTEMSDLTLIANTSTLFGNLDYVQQLSQDIVLGNVANAQYQGQTLGNLAVGSSPTQLEELVDKWFLGTDHPAAGSAYQLATGPLFGPTGPQYTDIHQGGLDDCYLMAGLAEVALKSPSTISNMFISNGDGTYTFRYYTDNQPYLQRGIVNYVTIDSQLPTGYADYSNELWVALAEKAYAQIRGSYSNLNFGSPGALLNQITGNTWMFPFTSSSDFATAYNAGAFIALSSALTPASPNIVGNHAYALVSYDATTQILTLYNPWGSLVTIAWADVSSNFSSVQGVNAS